MTEHPFQVQDVVRIIDCPANKEHAGMRGVVSFVSNEGAITVALSNGQICSSQFIERLAPKQEDAA